MTLQESSKDLADPLCGGGAEWSMTCNGCNSMTLCMPTGSLDMFCTEGTPYCVDGDDGFATCNETPTAGCEPTTEGTTEAVTTELTTVESTTETSTDIDTTTQLEITESTEPPTTIKPVPAMKCTGPGLFPDPRDCNAYHYCFAKGDQSHTVRCSEGSVFDYSSQQCKTLSSPADFCSLGTITVYRCPAAVVNSDAAGSCPFTCSKEGFFTNPLEPNTYFHCWRMYGARSLSIRMLYCPTWWEFDEKAQRCVFKRGL
ncbi:hypothetical protein pipiens_007255 [Culex pipiens pipiens]|uniref:Chitin-binding type-2 domain-containing protein n=1 Tax=Culex pipiens pipiens TaxID=38569 RepID=A0ABD1DMN4_CULPP